LQPFQALVHGEQPFVQSATCGVEIAKSNLHKAATPPLASNTPRVIYQHAPQLPGGNSEEMSAIDALHWLLATQMQVRFVHQGRGLERVFATFAAHLLRRHFVQLGIHEFHDAVPGDFVATAPLFQEYGDGMRFMRHGSPLTVSCSDLGLR
jgi:hypothetical protein